MVTQKIVVSTLLLLLLMMVTMLQAVQCSSNKSSSSSSPPAAISNNLFRRFRKQPLLVEGRVSCSKCTGTLYPIPGALVKLICGKEQLELVYTNAGGFFKIRTHMPKEPTCTLRVLRTSLPPLCNIPEPADARELSFGNPVIAHFRFMAPKCLRKPRLPYGRPYYPLSNPPPASGDNPAAAAPAPDVDA